MNKNKHMNKHDEPIMHTCFNGCSDFERTRIIPVWRKVE